LRVGVSLGDRDCRTGIGGNVKVPSKEENSKGSGEERTLNALEILAEIIAQKVLHEGTKVSGAVSEDSVEDEGVCVAGE